MSDTETALVAAWQQGDEQAVRAIFNRYYPRAVRLATLSGLLPEEAKDCAQEVFLRAFEYRWQLRDLATFPLWFQRITTRQILTALKVRQRTRMVPLEQANDLEEDWGRTQVPQPDEVAISAESRRSLWQQVQALPPKYRVPLVLRYYGDFTLREVAELLDQREGTTRVILHRALHKLRHGSQEAQYPEPCIHPASSEQTAGIRHP